MGLMFARRRMEEANKRAALKAEAHRERDKEAQEKHAAPVPEAKAEVKQSGGNKNGANSKGAK